MGFKLDSNQILVLKQKENIKYEILQDSDNK